MVSHEEASKLQGKLTSALQRPLGYTVSVSMLLPCCCMNDSVEPPDRAVHPERGHITHRHTPLIIVTHRSSASIVCISVSGIIPTELRRGKRGQRWHLPRGQQSFHGWSLEPLQTLRCDWSPPPSFSPASPCFPSLSLWGHFTVAYAVMHLIAQHHFRANSSKTWSSQRHAGD